MEKREIIHLHYVESVEVNKGTRVMETYGDAICSPRIRYYENEGCEMIVRYRYREA